MSSYERELVERLAPTIFDRYYAWGMVNEMKPAHDMPTSKGLKNEGNTLWAHLADIRIAWERAALTHKERRALVLHHGLGLSQKAAAVYEDVSPKVMNTRLMLGVGKLADYLNGTDNYTDQDDDGE